MRKYYSVLGKSVCFAFREFYFPIYFYYKNFNSISILTILTNFCYTKNTSQSKNIKLKFNIAVESRKADICFILLTLFSTNVKNKIKLYRGMKKEYMVHIYNGILLSHKKEQNNAICSNKDGPRDCHTE